MYLSQLPLSSGSFFRSHSDYQKLWTTDKQHLAAPIKNRWVLNLCLVKGFNAIVTSHSNVLGLKKQAFSQEFFHNFELSLKYDLLYAVVSEETGVKPIKPCFRSEKRHPCVHFRGIHTIHTHIYTYKIYPILHYPPLIPSRSLARQLLFHIIIIIILYCYFCSFLKLLLLLSYAIIITLLLLLLFYFYSTSILLLLLSFVSLVWFWCWESYHLISYFSFHPLLSEISLIELLHNLSCADEVVKVGWCAYEEAISCLRYCMLVLN